MARLAGKNGMSGQSFGAARAGNAWTIPLPDEFSYFKDGSP